MAEPEFGKYTLIAELGHGGMADVFLGIASGPVGFNKLLVVKRLRPNLVDEPDFVAMLVDEARLAARLNHPNVVQTYEVGQVGNQYFIAMEYLEGQPLHRVIQRSERKNPMPREMQLAILADALGGLDYAHDLADYDGTPLCVVHRDVSPHNVFVTYDGQVKVVDFGIAKAVGRQAETRTGMIKGKVNYMAPEQALGQPVDRRADVFACGVLLWEAATGKRLWKGMNDIAIVQCLLNGEMKRPREANPDVPADLEAIVMKALAADPDQRYASARELQIAIEEWFGKRGGRPASRAVGQFVSDLFADKRTEIKQLIEAQLARIRRRHEAAGPESLSVVEMPHSVPTSGTPSGVSSLSRPILAGSGGDPIEITRAAPLPGGSGKTKARWALLAFATALAVGVLAWTSFGQREMRAMARAAADTAESPPSAAPATTAAARVKVILQATPTSAKFSIDGGPLLDNPHVGEAPKDSGTHVVRVVADGFVTATRMVKFDDDVVVDVTLAAVPTEADSASAKEPPKKASAPPPPPPKPTSPARKQRPIDTDNPWSQ